MKPVSEDSVSGDQTPLLLGKREIILHVALRLFTSQGFHATPTSQISREAGISTGTLFHYFPDKNSLFEQLYLSIKKDMAQAVRDCDDPNLDPRTRLEQCFQGFVTWGTSNHEKFLFVEQFYHSPSISEEVKREAHAEFAWMNEITEDAIARGMIRDLPHEFYFVMVSQILFGVVKLISTGETGLSSEELVSLGLD
ncbi:MAG TPA: TetR/AcrR family transcriptional regulator, partial [Methanospirillum sp.]|uniref:TetR/AcrR family transcriptional regulator n=1 Tax=Methanospirillum sp. TaxID=45200 RepID=UPI002C087357